MKFKLTSKQKWLLVSLGNPVSWFAYYMSLGTLWFLLAIPFIVFFFCFSVYGLIECKVFERFAAWLKSDDK